jgi:diacylglycerol O-acyltransferase
VVRQLSGVDALHVLEETDAQHMHTVKIAVLAPGARDLVGPDDVRDWARATLLRIPPLRWQVHKIPLGLGRPVFVDAGPADVDRHVQVATLPAPGSDVELDAFVSRVASAQLPRDRPLWELHYVDGFADGRVALVFKLHHSIMDGQASVRFFEVAFDNAELPYGPVPAAAEPVPSNVELIGFALRSQARLYGRLPHVVRRTVASIRANRSRRGSTTDAIANPMSGPATRFNKLPRPQRLYVDVTVPFADVKAVKDATGRTVNEVFVALCGGAIRRYLESHGETPDKCLNCAHPVSLRAPEQADDYGNRTSYWYVSLGTDVADPRQRLDAVKRSLDAAREWAKGDAELFAVWQDYYFLFGFATLKTLALAERLSGKPAFNAIVSNVRGPRPLTLRGVPVVAVRSMGPITRTLGLNMTAWSYGENFSIGLQANAAHLPDLRSFDAHIRAELSALKTAVVQQRVAELSE